MKNLGIINNLLNEKNSKIIRLKLEEKQKSFQIFGRILQSNKY